MSKLVPHGVICLLSALYYHGMSDAREYQVAVQDGTCRSFPIIPDQPVLLLNQPV